MSFFLNGNPDRPRTLVHLNIADFAVAVERQADGRLRERPVIIAQGGGMRAVVYDMSEEAYQSGVRKAMPIGLAVRRCRDAVVLPPRPDRYERAMGDLFGEVRDYSPLVEPGENDGHFFIDMTGAGRLFGSPADAARRMACRIRKRFGLVPGWSVASNKLVSKVATRLVKPAGEYVVNHGGESAFLLPVPLVLLPGIEACDLQQLADFNLSTAGEVAGLGEDALAPVFGKRAGFIFDTVRGIDASPVMPAGQTPERVAASRTIGGDGIDMRDAARCVYALVEIIGAALRSRGRAARSLSIAVDYPDGMRCCRQLGVRPPSANDINLFQTARNLLGMAWLRRVRLSRITLACPKPVPHQPQMELFGTMEKNLKNDALMTAVDGVRRRFGDGAVRMGISVQS